MKLDDFLIQLVKYYIYDKINPFRLSQNSNHFYNWILGNTDFKFRSEIIPKFRYKLTLKWAILSQL